MIFKPIIYGQSYTIGVFFAQTPPRANILYNSISREPPTDTALL